MLSGGTFDVSGLPGPSMETSFAVLQIRSALSMSASVPSVQNQLDLADICLSAGLPGASRLLFEAAFIHQGFSAQRLVEQSRIAARTGLWHGDHVPTDQGPAAAGTVEIAIAEMRALARALGQSVARTVASRRRRDDTEPSPHATIPSREALADPSSGDLGQAVHALFLWLKSEAVPDNWDSPEALIAFLTGVIRRSPNFDHTRFAAAPLPLLASAVAFASLREFLLSNRDLMTEPLGSPEMLRRAASLDSAGLGPYFTNVQRIARKSRDITELAFVAASAADEDSVAIGPDPWIALLSRRLAPALLLEVVDDLGDRKALPALAIILDRTTRFPDERIDLNLITRLRDTALDWHDYDLASRAQAVIVRLKPSALQELQILGDIDGSGGRISAAELSYIAYLECMPGDEDVTARLVALRARKFGPFRILRGIKTPLGRQLNRARHGQAMA